MPLLAFTACAQLVIFAMEKRKLRSISDKSFTESNSTTWIYIA